MDNDCVTVGVTQTEVGKRTPITTPLIIYITLFIGRGLPYKILSHLLYLAMVRALISLNVVELSRGWRGGYRAWKDTHYIRLDLTTRDLLSPSQTSAFGMRSTREPSNLCTRQPVHIPPLPSSRY